METPDILNYQQYYYKKLYSESINIDDKPISELIGSNPNKLLEEVSAKLEGELTRYSQ